MHKKLKMKVDQILSETSFLIIAPIIHAHEMTVKYLKPRAKRVVYLGVHYPHSNKLGIDCLIYLNGNLKQKTSYLVNSYPLAFLIRKVRLLRYIFHFYYLFFCVLRLRMKFHFFIVKYCLNMGCDIQMSSYSQNVSFFKNRRDLDKLKTI